MATNPYFNKVVKGNQTIIDLTADTVTPADVRAGVTFHDLTGAAQVGTAQIGKTVASVAPAAVPSAWDSIVASYECVLVDCDNDIAEQRAATANVTGEFATLDALDYGIQSAVYAPPSIDKRASAYVLDPDGTATLLRFNAPGTTPATSAGGWAVSVATTDNNYVFTYKSGDSTATETVTTPSGKTPAGFYTEAAEGGVRYVVVCDDGTEARSTVRPVAESGIVWERCQCVGVTGTPSATTPGYLVTYSDATSETFPAASGDVADGSY